MPNRIIGHVKRVNGSIITLKDIKDAKMLELCNIGEQKLIGEVVKLFDEEATVQVYEDTTGICPGDNVYGSGAPLSVELGPGMIGSIYDGIQRPLEKLEEASGTFISKGLTFDGIDHKKKWHFIPTVKVGETVRGGSIVGTVQESLTIVHKVMVPPTATEGMVVSIVEEGDFAVVDDIAVISQAKSADLNIQMLQKWSIRVPRPVADRMNFHAPLVTGLRVIDTLFPLAKGGTVAIPGGFGTGKTMTQHALAKWSNAEIIVYIGCGERGNEMTEVLNDFPELIDPRTERPLIERTVMIANTSNMPVPAREVSIYTGVTIAEYYRDMGYSVAVMADSTSRWAEALRELASRLGDMPAEEGFPPYLATRLASFYERAGLVETLSGEEGSISIIGAVSPPGGDFSEPVTQHTTRFVRCFWALDKVLADARHYPSIGWIESYTEYLDDIKEWWSELDSEWLSLRNEAMNVLLEDNRLQQIVKLVGPDALPAHHRFVLYCAELIKNGFLQQNSFDPKDMYCSAEKQLKLLKAIVAYYREGKELLLSGVELGPILSLEIVPEIVRLKNEIGNEETEKIDTFIERLEGALYSLKQHEL